MAGSQIYLACCIVAGAVLLLGPLTELVFGSGPGIVAMVIPATLIWLVGRVARGALGG